MKKPFQTFHNPFKRVSVEWEHINIDLTDRCLFYTFAEDDLQRLRERTQRNKPFLRYFDIRSGLVTVPIPVSATFYTFRQLAQLLEQVVKSA